MASQQDDTTELSKEVDQMIIDINEEEILQQEKYKEQIKSLEIKLSKAMTALAKSKENKQETADEQAAASTSNVSTNTSEIIQRPPRWKRAGRSRGGNRRGGGRNIDSYRGKYSFHFH